MCGDQGEKVLLCVSIFIYIYIDSSHSKNALCKLGGWYVVDQTILTCPTEENRFCLVLFSLVWISQVVHII